MLQDRGHQRAESLCAELKAIVIWDEFFRSRPNHRWWETVAFENRRRRRNEIITELKTLGEGAASTESD